ncbi:hypothetical protein HPB50_029358 [Hyalomma asiaticum]|nr:hypothetical protein HPB50_029358 [Hyalomma asiaticum]
MAPSSKPCISPKRNDNETLEALKPYKEIVDNAVKEVVGSTKVLLQANDKQCRHKECNAVNLMADAFFDYYANRPSPVANAWSIVNAAVLNGGIARDSIQQKTSGSDDDKAVNIEQLRLYHERGDDAAELADTGIGLQLGRGAQYSSI